jgi:hypothetical protein
MTWRPSPQNACPLQALLDPSRPGLSQELRRQGDDDRRQIYWQPTPVLRRTVPYARAMPGAAQQRDPHTTQGFWLVIKHGKDL